MAIVYGLVFLFLAFTIAVSRITGYSIAVMVRDPNFVLDGHPIIGMQSHLGVLAWFSSACICLFCYGLLRQARRVVTPSALFFLTFGLVTLWLALDDLFLVHEYLAYDILNISESLIYGVYMVVLAGCLVKFRRVIQASAGRLLLLAALIFFGLSVASDIVFPEESAIWRIFLEDGFKLLGIVSWSGYFIRTALARSYDSC